MAKSEEFILHTGQILPFKISEILATASASGVGANSIFLGKVRADIIEGKKVREIEYSAYIIMAELVMNDILHHIHSKYTDLRSVKIIHSIGNVKAGEISLLVFAACSHRKEAFAAVQEIVELIKEKLPVWKKEIFEDTTYVWTHNDFQI